MYAKTFVVAAALAPVALAQVATIEPFNFDCNRGQYGYGWDNGGDNNGVENPNIADLLAHFSDISDIFQNGTLTTLTAPGGNIPQIAQTLFNHYRDAVCETLALKDSLINTRETDNEQHQTCLAKGFYDLTLNNWMMNMVVQMAPLKGSFVANNLPSISSCTASLRNALNDLSTAVNKVSPICTAQENVSTTLVRTTLDNLAQLFRM